MTFAKVGCRLQNMDEEINGKRKCIVFAPYLCLWLLSKYQLTYFKNPELCWYIPGKVRKCWWAVWTHNSSSPKETSSELSAESALGADSANFTDLTTRINCRTYYSATPWVAQATEDIRSMLSLESFGLSNTSTYWTNHRKSAAVKHKLLERRFVW